MGQRKRTASDELGDRLRQVRRAQGLSLRQVAGASGLSRRQVASAERGGAVSGAQLAALARACGVDVSVLAPTGSTLAIAGTSASGGMRELRGEAAFDALLREYLSMVLEFRGSQQPTPGSLREDDLRELAQALGDTPQAIEARLMALLGTGHEEAWKLRTTILPSSRTESSLDAEVPRSY